MDLGASPRATICWGRLVKVWALLLHRRSEVFPEDIQDLAKYILSHRVWLGPHAASHGVTVEMVIDDIIAECAGAMTRSARGRTSFVEDTPRIRCHTECPKQMTPDPD